MFSLKRINITLSISAILVLFAAGCTHDLDSVSAPCQTRDDCAGGQICGSDGRCTPGGGSDAAPDTSKGDASLDGPAGDTGDAAMADLGADGGMDAAREQGADTGTDAAQDQGTDAGIDGAVDQGAVDQGSSDGGGCVAKVFGGGSSSPEHTLAVNTVAFDPTGKYLASGSSDSTVIIWDLSGTSHKVLPKKHTQSVTSVAFSPDGKYLASGSKDMTVVIWDVPSFLYNRTLVQTSSPQPVGSVAFSADSKVLAVAAGSDIMIWDHATTSPTPTRTYTSHTLSVTSLAFNPKVQTELVSGSNDKKCYRWNYTQSSPVQNLSLKGGITSVSINAGGSLVAIATSSLPHAKVNVYSLPVGGASQQSTDLSPQQTVLTINSVVYGHGLSASHIALTRGKTIELWSQATHTYIKDLPGHTSTVQTVAFSPTSKSLASGSLDTTVRVWPTGCF